MFDSTVSIHKMTAEDIPFIAEIEKDCFSQPWTEAGLSSELDNPSAEFFTLTENGTVAAYMGMHIILDECYIANVAVKPDFRKKGYGQHLVKNAILQAEKLGCQFISLEVRQSNTPAISLYEKCGFESPGLRKGFYSHPTEDAVIMTKYINP